MAMPVWAQCLTQTYLAYGEPCSNSNNKQCSAVASLLLELLAAWVVVAWPPALHVCLPPWRRTWTLALAVGGYVVQSEGAMPEALLAALATIPLKQTSSLDLMPLQPGGSCLCGEPYFCVPSEPEGSCLWRKAYYCVQRSDFKSLLNLEPKWLQDVSTRSELAIHIIMNIVRHPFPTALPRNLWAVWGLGLGLGGMGYMSWHSHGHFCPRETIILHFGWDQVWFLSCTWASKMPSRLWNACSKLLAPGHAFCNDCFVSNWKKGQCRWL